jgi:hypothetical protein
MVSKLIKILPGWPGPSPTSLVDAPGARSLMQLKGRYSLRLLVCLNSGKRLHSYRKSPLLMDKSTISMAIFNSYVKLLEGKLYSAETMAETCWNWKMILENDPIGG